MKRDLFQKYVWLVDVIRHAGKITFEEISKLWKNSPLNDDHANLALRTFHNHRDAIERLFGIKILCDRSDHNQYYISDDNAAENTKLKVWMLQTLSLPDLSERSEDVEHRIVVDIPPEERFGLTSIIEAMKRNLKMKLAYQVPVTAQHRTELIVDPYCVRFWRNSWFMLAKADDTGEMIVIDLSRIVSIQLMEEGFIYDTKFKAAEFFRNYFGMDVDSSLKPVTVRMKVGGKTRDMIRTQPLHSSQKEVMADLDYSVFEYFFVPSDDFKKTVLSMGSEAEVISPEELRNEIRESILRMAGRYS